MALVIAKITIKNIGDTQGQTSEEAVSKDSGNLKMRGMNLCLRLEIVNQSFIK